jgi:nucleoid-associated protein YgaU
MDEKKAQSGTPAWGTPAGTKPSESRTAAAKPVTAAQPTPAAQAAATPAGENPYTQWYEVKKGDTLWKIAKEYYGDGSLYPEIFKANQDVLSDPDKIQVGQKLRIP